MKYKWLILIATAGAIAAVLSALAPPSKETAASQEMPAPGTVPCLARGIPLLQHAHTKLVIRVDGDEEQIPPNIGLSPSCEKAVHTHEPDGVIHVEAQDAKIYALGSFFSVWERDIERGGYALQVHVDGAPFKGDPLGIELIDGRAIELAYTSIGS